MPISELVQVTAQYSNAVLVAVMPYIADFAQKLNLPIQQPLTVAQVAQFKCDPRKDRVGGMVTLTNHFEFTFLDGRICVYRSPDSYFSLQEADVPTQFYGTVKLREKEAVNTARQAIQKLGYTEKQTHTETEPRVIKPRQFGKNSVPRYRVTWLDPSWQGARTASRPLPAIMDVEVNGENGRIEMFSMTSHDTRAPNPPVAVKPPVIPTQAKRSNLIQGSQSSWASKEYASAMLTNVVPLISEFAAQTKIPVNTPITTNDIDRSRYTCVIDQSGPVVQLYLKNGDRFNFDHGHVVGFYAHDAFFKFPEIGRVEDFIGKTSVSTNQAIAHSKEALKRLGYRLKLTIAIGPPTWVPAENFTRYFIRYSRASDNSPVSNFEMDLTDGSIKAVYLDDPILWRDPPKINVPMFSTTNAPSGS